MSDDRVLNNEYGLAKMQEDLLQTLDALDLICRKNNIKYAIHGGTILGAERDHHLIPWDDDIDVAMWRDEFEKFKNVVGSGKISGRYYLDETTMWFPRFVMKKQKAPVYIDIFIWDYISEHKMAQKMKIMCLRAIQGMMKEEVDYSRYDIMGKILIGVTQGMGRMISNKKKLEIFHNIQTKRFQGSRKYIHRSNDSYRGCTYILDSKYMDSYTEIDLEGKDYMVNERYHEFLVMEYGEDYLTPPPMKDRHPEHEQIRKSIEKKQKVGNT
jgi:LPS biosynthesis protein